MVRRIPLYHCCSSFLSKCVAFCRSNSSCCESLLWLCGDNVSPCSVISKCPIRVLLLISWSKVLWMPIFSAVSCLPLNAG